MLISYGIERSCLSFFFKITKTDVNECDVHNGGCSQFCFNKNGSHVCSCVNGYRSSDNGRLCTANSMFVYNCYAKSDLW